MSMAYLSKYQISDILILAQLLLAACLKSPNQASCNYWWELMHWEKMVASALLLSNSVMHWLGPLAALSACQCKVLVKHRNRRSSAGKPNWLESKGTTCYSGLMHSTSIPMGWTHTSRLHFCANKSSAWLSWKAHCIAFCSLPLMLTVKACSGLRVSLRASPTWTYICPWRSHTDSQNFTGGFPLRNSV